MPDIVEQNSHIQELLAGASGTFVKSSLVLSLADKTIFSAHNIVDAVSTATQAHHLWRNAVALAKLAGDPPPQMISLQGAQQAAVLSDGTYLIYAILEVKELEPKAE